MRQGNINKDTFGFRNSIASRKISKQPVETCRNRIESEVGETAFGVFKALTDQAESVIMKSVILSHPPFEIRRPEFAGAWSFRRRLQNSRVAPQQNREPIRQTENLQEGCR